MSLDNIQLPAAVVQALYSKSLYDLNANKSTVNNIQGGEIIFLGNNLKKVILLVNTEEALYLPDDELNFLLGILTACRLSMADIALINVSKNKALNYTSITEQLQAENIFLFGVDVAYLELPLQFPHYQIQQFNKQVYLSSVALSKLQADKEEKLKLWNCLKKIFSL